MALLFGRFLLRAATKSPPSLPLSSSLASFRRPCLLWRRLFSSSKTTDSTKLPLLLWIGDNDDARIAGLGPRYWPRSHPLLVPSVPVVEHVVRVNEDENDAVSVLVDLVEAHYGESDDFVGGMGESDQGVWLAGVGNHNDVLDHVLLIHEAIQTIQQHRHGIPFRLYSSGRPQEDVHWDSLQSAKKWALQISLFAPNPPDYARLTSGSTKDFSQLCGMIATVAESVPNIKLEIGVMQEYAGPSHALAASLGARQVFAYGPEDHVPTC
jgi:hypothetical protein